MDHPAVTPLFWILGTLFAFPFVLFMICGILQCLPR